MQGDKVCTLGSVRPDSFLGRVILSDTIEEGGEVIFFISACSQAPVLCLMKSKTKSNTSHKLFNLKNLASSGLKTTGS